MAEKKPQPPKNFEDALKELEKILTDIEGGEIGLEDSLSRYQRGTFLIQHCREILAKAEKQIDALSEGEDGKLRAEAMGEPGEEEMRDER